MEVKEIPLRLVQPRKDQPRRYKELGSIYELAESIYRVGLLEPILVRPLPDGMYEIIAGERRYQAFKVLGRETIPAIIREDVDDNTVHKLSVAENTSRVELKPAEIVLALRKHLRHLSDEEFSRKVKTLRSFIRSQGDGTEIPAEYKEFDIAAQTFGIKLSTLVHYAYLLADVPLSTLEILAEGNLTFKQIASIRKDPSILDRILASYRRIKPNTDPLGMPAGDLACQDVFIGLRKEKSKKRPDKVDRALEHLRKAVNILLDLEKYEEHAYKLEDLIAVIEGIKAAKGEWGEP